MFPECQALSCAWAFINDLSFPARMKVFEEPAPDKKQRGQTYTLILLQNPLLGSKNGMSETPPQKGLHTTKDGPCRVFAVELDKLYPTACFSTKIRGSASESTLTA
jgi:hypothetical protein